MTCCLLESGDSNENPFAKAGIKSINVGREDTQSEYRDGIWHKKMCPVNNEKWKTTNGRKNRTSKSRKKKKKKRTLGEKENYNYLEILEADTVKQAEMKENIKKRVL